MSDVSSVTAGEVVAASGGLIGSSGGMLLASFFLLRGAPLH